MYQQEQSREWSTYSVQDSTQETPTPIEESPSSMEDSTHWEESMYRLGTREKQSRRSIRRVKSPMLDYVDAVSILCHISVENQIKVAVKHSARGAVAAGAGAFLGGLVGGPIGIAAGGTVGSIVGAWMAEGKFRPIPEILMELSPKQQKQLCDNIYASVKNLEWADAAELLMLITNNADLKQKVAAVLIHYVTKVLKFAIKYGD